MPNLLELRARVLARRGRHEDAAATADRLSRLAGTAGNNLYRAAGSYALCAAAVAGGKQPAPLTPADRARRERYAARALALLKQAQAAGYFKTAPHRAQLKMDADRAPLRDRADFKALVAELEKTPLPAPQR